MAYSYGQLQSIWMQAAAGTKYATSAWAHLMAAIGLAESSGDPNATNPTDNNGTQTSWGIWQISLGNHSEPAPDWNNPITNAKLAIGKLNTQGITAWGTYDSGAYRQYMSGAPPTDVSVPSGGSPGTSGTPQQAQTTSWNPVTWVEAPIKGLENLGSWPIKFAQGEVKQAETLGSGLADMVNTMSGLVKAVSKIGQLFSLLFQPAFWLRVGAFLAGAVAIAGAGYFFVNSLGGNAE